MILALDAESNKWELRNKTEMSTAVGINGVDFVEELASLARRSHDQEVV